MNPLSRKIGTLQSSYTQAINKQENRTGSLFQQKVKYKSLESPDLIFTCFHYIHQNPVKAGLCSKMEAWPYSSFYDYINSDVDTLVNKNLAYELLEIPESPLLFYKQSLNVIRDDQAKKFV